MDDMQEFLVEVFVAIINEQGETTENRLRAAELLGIIYGVLPGAAE